MLKRTEIQIRDPFILTDHKENKYFLYGTTDKNCWGNVAVGFDAYSSTDLENWEGPFQVFRPEENFWASKNFWAPEVYYYNNKYYMLASFKADGVCRGTQILVADSPEGPFFPQSEGPVTPRDWECLDGTLFIDNNNEPWIIFSHEWTQVYDGQICAMKLSKNLDASEGEPILLFNASEAQWVKFSTRKFDEQGTTVERKVYVTDGPFMYRADNGELLMLWSSSGKEGYAMGIARSISGEISGPWVQEKNPIYSKDGGHGMIFKTFNGRLMITIHTPNKTPNERPAFFEIVDDNGKLRAK